MSVHGVRLLADEIRRVIDQFRSDEWDVTYEEVLGVMEVIKHDLLEEIEVEEDDA